MSAFVHCFKLTIPILMAFFPLGAAFGLVAYELEFMWYEALAMSFFIYAGSSEFVVASMIAGGESLTKILVAGLFVNFRHVFYGLSVHDSLPRSGFLRYYTIWTLSDEVYALMTTIDGIRGKVAAGFSALVHFYWYGSVLIGFMVGQAANLKIPGIDYCLPALFIVLVIEQAHKLREWWPFVIGLVSSGVAYVIYKDQLLVMGIFLSIAAFAGVYLRKGHQHGS